METLIRILFTVMFVSLSESEPICIHGSFNDYICKDVVSVFPIKQSSEYYGFNLVCQNCKISVFSSSTFKENYGFTSLNISNSELQSIESFAFKKLRIEHTINFQNNKISKIAVDAFQGLRGISTIDLENNSIGELIPGFVRVDYFSLANNKLEGIQENAFVDVLSMANLILSNNKIRRLYYDSLAGMISLGRLELNNNELCHIPTVFKELRFLDYLNLADNKLTTFSRGIFYVLSNLETLILANNSMEFFDGEVSLENNFFKCDDLVNIIRDFKSKTIIIDSKNGRYNVQNIC